MDVSLHRLLSHNGHHCMQRRQFITALYQIPMLFRNLASHLVTSRLSPVRLVPNSYHQMA
ncbi:hypothetical protein SERLA73DRAFT_135954, partial [Serpula lacrymans var. lacrymans S7.3]